MRIAYVIIYSKSCRSGIYRIFENDIFMTAVTPTDVAYIYIPIHTKKVVLQ